MVNWSTFWLLFVIKEVFIGTDTKVTGKPDWMWQKKIDERINYYMCARHLEFEIPQERSDKLLSFWSQHFRFEAYFHDKKKRNGIQMLQIKISHITGLTNSDPDPNPRCHLLFCYRNTLDKTPLRCLHKSFISSY